jgi:hypothetical protein
MLGKILKLIGAVVLLAIAALFFVTAVRPQWFLWDGWDLPGGKDGKGPLPYDRSAPSRSQ